jgi:protein-disulfide isomerase
VGRNRRQQRLNERRSRRDEETPAAPEARRSRDGALSARAKPAWRQTIDSWGGFTVLGAIGAAVLVGALLVFINRPGATANTEAFTPHERDVPVAGAFMGDPSAPVRMIAYVDFQCPFCKQFSESIEPALIEEFVSTGVASLEVRHYAFMGTESLRAAEAASCAADQDRFWDFQDLLFLRQGRQNSGVYSDSNLRQYARTIGEAFSDFNVSEWETCFDGRHYELEVQEESARAANSGVASTPTLIVNGQMLGGVQSMAVYRQAVETAVAAGGR